jgi:hypothetical protein
MNNLDINIYDKRFGDNSRRNYYSAGFVFDVHGSDCEASPRLKTSGGKSSI